MGVLIGAQNVDLKAPPAWAFPLDRRPTDVFGLFMDSERRQWAFLYRDGEVRLAGTAWAWRERTGQAKVLRKYRNVGGLDPAWMMVEAGSLFDVEGEALRLWLLSCLMEAARARRRGR